jgi:hypothetical protein
VVDVLVHGSSGAGNEERLGECLEQRRRSSAALAVSIQRTPSDYPPIQAGILNSVIRLVEKGSLMQKHAQPIHARCVANFNLHTSQAFPLPLT